MHPGVSEDQVRAALERVLAAPEFVNATRLSRFLRYAVEKALAGGGAELKEYLLGVEVFRPLRDLRTVLHHGIATNNL